jgi:hypothetical protein
VKHPRPLGSISRTDAGQSNTSRFDIRGEPGALESATYLCLELALRAWLWSQPTYQAGEKKAKYMAVAAAAPSTPIGSMVTGVPDGLPPRTAITAEIAVRALAIRPKNPQRKKRFATIGSVRPRASLRSAIR